MKKNMGTADSIIRTLLAVLIVFLYFTDQISGVAAVILGVVAVIFIITSSVNFCPLYHLLGISTRKKLHKNEA